MENAMAISEKAINAALKGPEAKKIKISEPNSSRTHEFNIKPVSYRVHKDELTIFGQLSHHLSIRDDDQLWFTFKKTGAKITPAATNKMVVEIQEGGAIKTIVKLKPIGVAIGAYFGVDAGKYFDMVTNHAEKLSFIDFDSGWEKAAGSLLEELARKVSPPKSINRAGLQLFEHSNMQGKNVLLKVGQNLKHTKSIGWNDKASSVLAFVPDGKKLELYQHDNFRGRVLELGPGSHVIRDLKIHKLGDEITSILWENP